MKTSDYQFSGMAIENYRDIASQLPSQGGVEIGSWLEQYAAAVPPGSSIVELGCWLGAGTAHLALGAMQSGAEIHCFDRWCATAQEVEKAAAFDVWIEEGQDLLPIFKANLQAFPVKICYHKCNLAQVQWNGGPIGLYVDDATKVDKLWLKAMEVFKVQFVPNTILVLMDYHFNEKAGDNYAAQKRYMAAHEGEFELLEERMAGTTVAAFRYLES